MKMIFQIVTCNDRNNVMVYIWLVKSGNREYCLMLILLEHGAQGSSVSNLCSIIKVMDKQTAYRCCLQQVIKVGQINWFKRKENGIGKS